MDWKTILQFKECKSHETNIKYEVIKLILFKYLIKHSSKQIHSGQRIKLYTEHSIFEDKKATILIENFSTNNQIIIKLFNNKNIITEKILTKEYKDYYKESFSLFKNRELKCIYINELPTDINNLDKAIEILAEDLIDSTLKGEVKK